MNRTGSTWNLDPPPGFQGLRDDLPLNFYFRHLPHWRQPGATYFVTFRLADSLPQAKLRELDLLRTELRLRIQNTGMRLDPRNPANSMVDSIHRQIVLRVERWLDEGYGDCWLGRPEANQFAADAVRFLDQQQYELGCFVIMPNHVHAVIRPYASDDQALAEILHSRKLWIANNVNRLVHRSGTFWQQESFDRIIRDEEHLYRCIQYIGRNPKRAGLTNQECSLWIQPSWTSLGWNFEQ